VCVCGAGPPGSQRQLRGGRRAAVGSSIAQRQTCHPVGKPDDAEGVAPVDNRPRSSGAASSHQSHRLTSELRTGRPVADWGAWVG
jgi:hypothetical protein